MITDHPDADYVRVPRPRSIARLLLDLVRLRANTIAYQVRGETITAVTETLSSSGCAGRIVSRESGYEWSVTVIPPAAGGLLEAR